MNATNNVGAFDQQFDQQLALLFALFINICLKWKTISNITSHNLKMCIYKWLQLALKYL